MRTVKAETETALLGKADTNGYFKVEDGIYHLEAELNEKNVGRVADSVEKLCAEQFQNADCYVAVIPDKIIIWQINSIQYWIMQGWMR